MGSTETRGGIATYVRVMQQTPLWTDWNIRHIVTHRDGSTAAKIGAFARGAVLFVVELIRFRPNVVHLHAAVEQLRPEGDPVVDQPACPRARGRAHSRVRLPGVLREFTASDPGVDPCDPLPGERRRRARRRAGGPAAGDRPDARITVIPNAVRPAQRTAQPALGEPVRVVFLGRIGDRKGTFRLLDAWAELARDPDFSAGPGKAATLTIAGDGEVERARRRIRELRLEDTVEVREWLSESDVGELLDHAQVLVLPSRNEGQPMAVLEAMARGLCVIASDVGGLPEMIGGGCGVIVSPDDIEAIAAALRLVIQDHELRARYGAAAYARVADQFDVRTVWRRLDALYREVSR